MNCVKCRLDALFAQLGSVGQGLPVEEVRFILADHQKNIALGDRREPHRAHRNCLVFGQMNIRLHVKETMGPDIEQAAQQYAAFDQVVWQAIILRPVRRDHHPAEMTAGGVP